MSLNPSRHAVTLILSITFTLATNPVLAQPGQATLVSASQTPITQAQRDRMSRSLVTVQTVTLLRERGMLDERQRARVTILENELASALAARDAATGRAAQAQTTAQARLEQARNAFDAEVADLMLANQSLQMEIDALRDTMLVSLPTLTDEEVRLRQRFADGDRVGTRAILEALDAQWDATAQLSLERAQAQLVQTTNLQRAARKRDTAQRAAVSVSQGDVGATTLQVLDLWDAAAALDPADFWTHIERTRLAQTIGSLPRARAAAEDAARAAREDWQRGVAFSDLGDVAVVQGDLERAAQAYQEFLGLYRRLVNANPDQMWLQRNLSVSLERVGDVAVARGDFVGAGIAFEEGLATRRQLLANDPNSSEAQRDLSVSLERVGDVAVARGNLGLATTAYGESLAIRRVLSASDPTSTQVQRDLSVSFNKNGDVSVARGDLAGANAAYGETLAIDRRLAMADPSSAQAQRDVSHSLHKIGDVAVGRGDFVRASVVFSESLEIARRLSLADPSSSVARRDVGLSMQRLAQISGSNISWAEVAAHWQAIKRDGILIPSDEQNLIIATQKARQETVVPMAGTRN